jgi:hypothetical protein
MTRINLLPPEIKQRVERPHLAPWFILMGVVTLVIIVGLFLLFSAQKKGKEDTLEEKQQQLQDLQRQTQPMKKYEDQQSELKSLQDLYNMANAGRIGWAQMLNDLAMYVPEGLATASNPKAPAIWLTRLSIDATSLEAAAGGGTAQPTATQTPIILDGYATPAWLCIQTWLPRASDFKAKGFLDAYPYYYYFKGHPKVAEFFVRLQNMEEWSNLWITDSSQETVSETMMVMETPTEGQPAEETEVTYSDWAIRFSITAQWNPENAIWATAAAAEAGGN